MDDSALNPFSSLYLSQNNSYELSRIQDAYSLVRFGFQYLQNKKHHLSYFSCRKQKELLQGQNEDETTQKKEESTEIRSTQMNFSDDHVKIQEKIQLGQISKKIKENQFQYYDPGQALFLTFGIEDISFRLKNSCSEVKIQEFDKNQNLALNSKSMTKAHKNLQYEKQFHVTEPNFLNNPFLIIKSKPSKRRPLTRQEYQKRALEIEKRRNKNLHIQDIEETIGKKLPIKNKKWQRKKPSLVFNANAYKKKHINSKKSKSQTQKIKSLFTQTQ